MKNIGTQHLCDPSLLVKWKRIPNNLVENKSFKLGLERMGFLNCVLTICIPLELQDLYLISISLTKQQRIKQALSQVFL